MYKQKEKKISFEIKYTSPANEFHLHTVETNKKRLKNVLVQLMSFYYIYVKTIG